MACALSGYKIMCHVIRQIYNLKKGQCNLKTTCIGGLKDVIESSSPTPTLPHPQLVSTSLLARLKDVEKGFGP